MSLIHIAEALKEAGIVAEVLPSSYHEAKIHILYRTYLSGNQWKFIEEKIEEKGFIIGDFNISMMPVSKTNFMIELYLDRKS